VSPGRRAVETHEKGEDKGVQLGAVGDGGHRCSCPAVTTGRNIQNSLR
jgi:hypothetical protein